MTRQELVAYLPLEKSWIIRMGLLDLVHGRDQIKTFLSSQFNLGDDLLALQRVAEAWDKDEPLEVGESGTLYRFLLFICWSLRLDKQFAINGTLKDRHVTQDSSITQLPQEELLKLDGHTSQWASAKALLGDKERLKSPPHLLAVTYDALDHWQEKVSRNLNWQPKLDRTIKAQAEAFLEFLINGHSTFRPIQAEDYCFARALDLIEPEEGERRWPALRNHESDRIESMEKELASAKQNNPITSRDHRVVQAVAIWGRINKKDVHIEHPKSVNKTWPLFWEFINKA